MGFGHSIVLFLIALLDTSVLGRNPFNSWLKAKHFGHQVEFASA
jgi:hypothetical protein